MNITHHAVKRYNERILKNFSEINTFKFSIISKRILNSIKPLYNTLNLEGYYKIDTNIYGLLKNNTVITVIMYVSSVSFIEPKSCRKRNKLLLKNQAIHIQERKKLTKKRIKNKKSDKREHEFYAVSFNKNELLKNVLLKEKKLEEEKLKENIYIEVKKPKLKKKKNVLKEMKASFEALNYKPSERRSLKIIKKA